MRIHFYEKNHKAFVVLEGNLDCDAQMEFDRLEAIDAKRVVFNWRDVTNITSSGLRLWIEFLRRFGIDREISFEECSPAVVVQLHMVPSFSSGVRIESFLGEYYCEPCHRFEYILHKANNESDDDEMYACPECAGKLSVEDGAELFFDQQCSLAVS